MNRVVDSSRKMLPVGPRATRRFWSCSTAAASARGVDRLESRRHSLGQRSHPDSRQGQKQRYVPLGDAAAQALRAYSPSARRGWPRLTIQRATRRRRSFSICNCVDCPSRRRGAVDDGAALAASSSASLFYEGSPLTCIRTPFVTPSARICWKKARTCVRFRSYWAMKRLSTTQRYTQLTTAQLTVVLYDRTHPRAR